MLIACCDIDDAQLVPVIARRRLLLPAWLGYAFASGKLSTIL
jgi:hypothetical protein